MFVSHPTLIMTHFDTGLQGKDGYRPIHVEEVVWKSSASQSIEDG